MVAIIQPASSGLLRADGQVSRGKREGYSSNGPPTAKIMRAVIQRVKRASVIVNDQTVSEIGTGIVCLIGIREGDGPEQAEWLCKQILAAKLFEGMGKENADKRWRSSVQQNGFEVLLVSQFTLNGRLCRKGGKVDFSGSMPPEEAKAFYERFVRMVKVAHDPDRVKDGLFGAKMDVALVNDGPITVIVDSSEMSTEGSASAATDAGKQTVNVGGGGRGWKAERLEGAA